MRWLKKIGLHCFLGPAYPDFQNTRYNNLDAPVTVFITPFSRGGFGACMRTAGVGGGISTTSSGLDCCPAKGLELVGDLLHP